MAPSKFSFNSERNKRKSFKIPYFLGNNGTDRPVRCDWTKCHPPPVRGRGNGAISSRALWPEDCAAAGHCRPVSANCAAPLQ